MEIRQNIKQLIADFESLRTGSDIEQKKQALLEIQDKLSDQDVWSDVERATKLSKESALLANFINQYDTLAQDVDFVRQLSEDDLGDQEIVSMIDHIMEKADAFTKLAFLDGKYDGNDAVVAIHAGAGGDDATDFAAMLLRMIVRYSESCGFKVNIIDKSISDVAGIKSVLFDVKGDFAYGRLKSEHGVHRLVRLSPFNSGNTRETSFALIEVLPMIEEVEFKIDDKDLEYEYTTAGGHGGQSVNTTYSAVRLTHIPTGIKVSIQNERSQAQNKQVALKILTSRLQKLYEEQAQQNKKDLRGEYKSAEWSNQIRNYVIHPYKLVKDTRTGYETSDVEAVLEGGLEEISRSYLAYIKAK